MCTLPLNPLARLSDDSSNNPFQSSCRNRSTSNYITTAELENSFSKSPSLTSFIPLKANGVNGIHTGVFMNCNGKLYANGNSMNNHETDKDSDSFLEAESVMAPSTPGKNSVDEFFDAFEEDYASEDESQKSGSRPLGRSPNRGFYRDLATRLHQENVKRTKAEEMLQEIQNQRDELASLLLQKGIPLPETITVPEEIVEASKRLVTNEETLTSGNTTDEHPESLTPGIAQEDSTEQEEIAAIPVTENVVEDSFELEKEEGVGELIVVKEAEIARLKDKLQYWEQMNLELSRQNQQASELARAKRKRQKQIRKAVLIGLGIAVGLGITVSASYGLFPFHSLRSTTSQSASGSTETELVGLEASAGSVLKDSIQSED